MNAYTYRAIQPSLLYGDISYKIIVERSESYSLDLF